MSDWIDLDSFAGGGGASTGLRSALEKPVDIAINHSDAAIAMHTANHPETRHYCESIWEVNPREACRGRKVRVAWFSPDCTHFSRAKGGKPRDKNVRGLAGVVIEWAREVRPRVIILENVREFQDWGPLDEKGHPIAARKGEDFRAWLAELGRYYPTIEHRMIRADRHGAPTSRDRFYLVARLDGQRVRWPEPTHGEGTPRPVRTAAEIIDWSLPCRSIFGRKKPLAEATLRRIAAGLRRYVIESADPFIVPVKSWGGGGIGEPLRMTLEPDDAAEAAFIEKFYSTARAGSDARAPLPTVTATGSHLAEVRAFLVKYYGDSDTQKQRVDQPLDTVTTKARFGLVTVHGRPYRIVDIGLRMLSPRELFNAQGFPADYVIDVDFEGRPMTKTLKIELAGNSVCPPVAHALAAANVHERWEAA